MLVWSLDKEKDKIQWRFVRKTKKFSTDARPHGKSAFQKLDEIIMENLGLSSRCTKLFNKKKLVGLIVISPSAR